MGPLGEDRTRGTAPHATLPCASPRQRWLPAPTPHPNPATQCPAPTAPRRTVLVVKPEWGEKILNGEKTLEIRRGNHKKHVGERIGLCFSGTGAIQGFVDFMGAVGPLDVPTWRARRRDHCVPGDALPYGACTWGWEMANPERLEAAIQFERKPEAVIFQCGVRL